MKSKKRRDDGWSEGRSDDGSRDHWAEDSWRDKDGYQQGTAAGYPEGGHANGAGYADQDQYGNQPRGRGTQSHPPWDYEPGPPGAPGYPEPHQPGGGRSAAAGYARPRFPEARGYDFGGQDMQAYTGGRAADPAYGDQRQADRQVNGQNGPSPASGREFLPPGEAPAGNDNEAGNMRPYGRLTIFTLLDDKAAEFDWLAERAAEGVRMAEPDTLVFVIHVVPKAPMQRIIYEIYRDRAAFEEHERQPHMQRFAADCKTCVLATNVVDLRLKYAKVGALGAPEGPPVPPVPPGRSVPPVPVSWRETKVDWASGAPGPRVPSAAGPPGQWYPERANGQYPDARYPAANGQYPASGNGQYGGGHRPGAVSDTQQNGGRYPEPADGRQPDGGARPPENGGGYLDRDGFRTGRHGGS